MNDSTISLFIAAVTFPGSPMRDDRLAQDATERGASVCLGAAILAMVAGKLMDVAKPRG